MQFQLMVGDASGFYHPVRRQQVGPARPLNEWLCGRWRDNSCLLESSPPKASNPAVQLPCLSTAAAAPAEGRFGGQEPIQTETVSVKTRIPS
jgi:hypothetical protein